MRDDGESEDRNSRPFYLFGMTTGTVSRWITCALSELLMVAFGVLFSFSFSFYPRYLFPFICFLVNVVMSSAFNSRPNDPTKRDLHLMTCRTQMLPRPCSLIFSFCPSSFAYVMNTVYRCCFSFIAASQGLHISTWDSLVAETLVMLFLINSCHFDWIEKHQETDITKKEY